MQSSQRHEFLQDYLGDPDRDVEYQRQCFGWNLRNINLPKYSNVKQNLRLFEIILNGMAVFNHSNITLPKRMETWWRLGIVTPSMHSIHHSIKMKESNSNYGFNLSLWDRIFGSYTAQANGDLKLGLKEFPDTKWTLNLKDLILFPFRFRGNSE